MPHRLTPTSYALLGLLNVRPWSAYELTKYMQRTALSDLWPRTEASIYREPKSLVDHGLATATTAAGRGERTRTVYEITDAGRDALRAWLGEPGDDLRFECESAVQVFFADAGGLDELRANLAAFRTRQQAGRAFARGLIDSWLAGDIRFPERLQYTAMAGDLIARVRGAVAEWAAQWEANVAEWETTALHPVSERQARECLAALARLVDAQPPL